MACLKCGVETVETQVFCDACREIMEQYPVKTDTPVHILQRPAPSNEKKAAPHREQTTATQLSQLRRMIRGLLVIIAILSALLCLTACLLIYLLNN